MKKKLEARAPRSTSSNVKFAGRGVPLVRHLSWLDEMESTALNEVKNNMQFSSDTCVSWEFD